jgi:hypothetical protein
MLVFSDVSDLLFRRMKLKAKILQVALALVMLSVDAFAQKQVLARQLEKELLSQNPSATFRCRVGYPLPVVSLPARVPAPEGKITLWADFAAADEKGVPLYVVNQTNQEHSYSTQDHDIYVKLEFKDATGAWRRAQAHRSSGCGLSYYSVTLPPRQFFSFRGYMPSTGSKQVVRYAVRGGDLSSNESTGWISDADLKVVALDSLTEREIPQNFWHAFEMKVGEPLPLNPSLKSRAEDVRSLIWYPRNEIAINRARELKAKVSELPASEDRVELLSALDDFLAKVDLQKPTPEALVQLCMARISDDSTADVSMTKDTAWRLLVVPTPNGDRLGASANGPDPRQWRKLIAPAVTLLKDTKQSTNGGAADAILSAGWMVDALVTDDELLAWLSQTSSERLQDLGAVALARRFRFSRLVEFAWEQPGPVQIRILSILAYAGPNDPSGRRRRMVRTPSFEVKEHLFWEHCAKTMPIETANALWSYDDSNGKNPFNRLIHDPLRDHFKSVSAISDSEVEISWQNSYPLRTALQMLASWRMEEDDAVMLALLKHGAYIKKEIWESGNPAKHVIKKQFFYREIAKQALIARGQAVPSDVVLESVISSVPEK